MTLPEAKDLVLGIVLSARNIPADQAVERAWATETVVSLLEEAGMQVETDLPFPPPAAGLKLDILGTAPTVPRVTYAIDLILGSDIDPIGELQEKMKELAQYPGEGVVRWVVAIGDSNDARLHFKAFADDAANRAEWGLETETGIHALVAPVSPVPPDPPDPDPPEPDPPPPDPPGPSPDRPTRKEASFMNPTQGLLMWNPTSTAGVLGLATDVVRDYGASGSLASTTGTIAANSCTLTLAQPLDFVTGQGICVAGAGPDGGPLVTTILGGGGTRSLTLAASAVTPAEAKAVRHDDSWAWQAAIDGAAAPCVITCPPSISMNVAATIRLRTGVALAFPSSALNWIGPDGGSVFTAGSFPLAESGILGGWLNPGGAGCVVDVIAPQYCVFDLEVRDGAPNLTVMRWTGLKPDKAADAPAQDGRAGDNVVRRFAAGTCGTLLELAGQQGAPVSANTFHQLLGRDCRVAGIACGAGGHVETNLFIRTDLTLRPDPGAPAIGIKLGQDDATPAIQDLTFTSLSIRNPDGQTCTGLSLHRAAQVQVLSYDHPGFDENTAVNQGLSPSFYIRSAGDGASLTVADTTRGWSVTPLQISPSGKPVTFHCSCVQTIETLAVIPSPGLNATVNLPVEVGDTVIATPVKLTAPPVLGLAWSACVLMQGQVQLNLITSVPAPGSVPGPTIWRFDVWRHTAGDGCSDPPKGGKTYARQSD